MDTRKGVCVCEKEIQVQKIKGENNPADLMTKHLSETKAKASCEALGVDFRSVRVGIRLDVQRGNVSADTKVVQCQCL